MENKMTKIILIHNEIAPYRVPLFNELSKKYSLIVFFGREKNPQRLWKTHIDKSLFRWRIPKGITLLGYRINIFHPFMREIKQSDIVILSDNVDIYPIIILSAIFAKFARKPIIIWTGHISTEYLNYKQNKIKRLIDNFLKKILYFSADLFVVYSKKTKHFLLNFKISPSKIISGTTQIYPVEIISKPRNCDMHKISPRKRLVVLSIGYFEERKGFEYLINAIKTMKRRDILLVIGGSGKYEKILKKYVGLDERIKFAGYIDGETKACLFFLSDVFVFPTLHDPWGFVVNESLYYGVPVILTYDAGSSEVIISGKNGFKIPSRDINSIKNILSKLAENPKYIKKMKRIAQKTSKNLIDVKYGTKPFEKAIETIINDRC